MSKYSPEYEIKSFALAAELLEEYDVWELDLSRQDQRDLKNVVGRTAALLEDIGLNPDYKYSIEDISRIKTALLWAIGGGK